MSNYGIYDESYEGDMYIPDPLELDEARAERIDLDGGYDRCCICEEPLECDGVTVSAAPSSRAAHHECLYSMDDRYKEWYDREHNHS